jgi:sRNA-binding carbon storage regulator CsrA
MRFIRENIYERIQREIKSSLNCPKGRITSVELTPSEWREFTKHVSVRGNKMRMAFQADVKVFAFELPDSVQEHDVHYVDVFVKYDPVGF